MKALRLTAPRGHSAVLHAAPASEPALLWSAHFGHTSLYMWCALMTLALWNRHKYSCSAVPSQLAPPVRNSCFWLRQKKGWKHPAVSLKTPLLMQQKLDGNVSRWCDSNCSRPFGWNKTANMNAGLVLSAPVLIERWGFQDLISWIKRIHPRWELSCSAQHVSCLGLTGLLVWVWSVCWGGLTEHDWQLVSSLDSLCWLQSVRNMTLFTTVSLSAAFCVMNEDKLPPCMTDSYSTAQNNSSCRAENRFIWFPWVVSTGVCSTSAEVNWQLGRERRHHVIVPVGRPVLSLNWTAGLVVSVHAAGFNSV